MRNYSCFLLLLYLFNFFLFWWGIGIASESKLEVLKDGWFSGHNCFYYFFTFLFSYYFIIIATSHVVGDDSDSFICVGKDYKSFTGIVIRTKSHVCLEVNTHTGTLDYFINDKHIKDRVVNVPKDVYFGVWYFFIFFIFIYWYENTVI
jgi:hypothetical protein